MAVTHTSYRCLACYDTGSVPIYRLHDGSLIRSMIQLREWEQEHGVRVTDYLPGEEEKFKAARKANKYAEPKLYLISQTVERCSCRQREVLEDRI